mmetsp:Transcript_81464/g.252866  ORF Transcript_81464/g.252866 Transcript_81464/m.252866 type:complete len:119 (+) Transcript_81464:147-503(+)
MGPLVQAQGKEMGMVRGKALPVEDNLQEPRPSSPAAGRQVVAAGGRAAQSPAAAGTTRAAAAGAVRRVEASHANRTNHLVDDPANYPLTAGSAMEAANCLKPKTHALLLPPSCQRMPL